MVFQAKHGCAADLIANFKEGAEYFHATVMKARHARLLTDLSGPFDTVVQELEFDRLEDFFEGSARLFADQRFREQGQPVQDLMQGGYKEFYTIEYAE